MAYQQAMDLAPDIAFFAPPKRKRKPHDVSSWTQVSDAPATRPSREPARANGRPLQPSVNASRHCSSHAESIVAAAKPSEATDKLLDWDERGKAGAAILPDSATFRDLGVSDWLDRVCRSLGMTTPTQVQRGCIPAILAGRDVIGTAHTGSGKTAAFALPILQHLAKEPFGIFALVLTPTRELAFQLADQFRALGAGITLKDCVIVGGLDMQQQAKELARRPHVVIATPGRLQGLLAADTSFAAGFERTRYLVLDEADRLLEPSFEPELRGILSVLPARRQTLLFSATMTRSLVALQSATFADAFHFEAYEGLQTAQQLRQEYLLVPAKVKDVYLVYLLQQLADLAVRSAIVFCSTCDGCHLLAAVLDELGLSCVALHSHKSQKRRLAALHTFKAGSVPILLATDVASRGLDIPTVDLVVNYDLPVAARDYVHRVGRTARAGRKGWSLSMVTQYDVDLVHNIEGLTGVTVEAYDMDEADVLKGITRVFKAKRAASMRIAEERGFEGVTASGQAKKRARRQLARN